MTTKPGRIRPGRLRRPPALRALVAEARISAVAETSSLPLAASNVSGEYSAVTAAAERGWMNARAVAIENLLAMRRAGADILITDHAREARAGSWL